jgi:hypothetical protein
MIKQIVTVLTLCSLAACASHQEGEEEELYSDSGTSSDCISQSAIRDYTVLDDTNLIVVERATRKYHVQLTRPAYGLRSTTRLAFHSATGRVCERFSDIIMDDGFGPDRIRIQSIQRLTPQEEEDLLVRFGKKEPDVIQTREPETVEGAEVEELD